MWRFCLFGALERPRERERESEEGRKRGADWLTVHQASCSSPSTSYSPFRTKVHFPSDPLDGRKRLIVDIYINVIVHLPFRPVPFHPNSDPSVITNSNSGVRLHLDDFPEGILEQINFLELWVSYI